MRKLLVTCLFSLSFNCYSQVEVVGDKVCMSLQDYRTVRSKVIICDTLAMQCDSAKIELENGLRIKDNLIAEIQNKITLKDSVISQKDITIKTISEIKNPSKFKVMDAKFLLGVILGMISVLIVR